MTISIERITEPVNDTNGYIIVAESDKSCIIVDPCDANLMDSFLRQESLVPEYVLLTHEHHDHIAGLNGLRKKYDLKVLCSELCNRGIQNSTVNFSRHFAEYIYFKKNGLRIEYDEFVCEPADIVFKDRYRFEWRQHKFMLYETPGHSKGGVSITLDDRYLFSGDSLLIHYDVILRFPGGRKKDFLEITLPFFQRLDGNLQVLPGHGKGFLLSTGLKTMNMK